MEENTNNGMPNNAQWGNMSWGAQPYWNQPKTGSTAMDTAALILGIVGTGLGLLGGGLGIFNNQRGPNGGNGGPNVMDRLAAVEAAVAVNTQRDVDLAKQTELMIEVSKKDAEIKILEAKAQLGNQLVAVNNQVITNTGVLGCVENKVNSLIQIGIPQANIIPTPTAAASASTNG